MTGHPAIGAEDGGHSQNKSKGGLKLSLLRPSHHDMAKPQLVLALKELSVGGIMLQSTDSQWRYVLLKKFFTKKRRKKKIFQAVSVLDINFF